MTTNGWQSHYKMEDYKSPAVHNLFLLFIYRMMRQMPRLNDILDII